MMNNTHILDSVMHMVGAPCSHRNAGKRKSAVTTLLERLGICRSPRILNAVCLTGDGAASAARP